MPFVEKEHVVQNQESKKPAVSASIRIAMLALLAAILTLGTSALAQQLPPTGYLSFDAPNSGTGSNQGTYPNAINRYGWIGGTVVYSTGASHGFLRKPNGAFIAVNPPGSLQSFVDAINDSDEAVGQFYGTSATYGFLRDAAGNYTQLAVAGADTTTATGINGTGTIAGYEHDATGYHGFLWNASHGFTVFDVPGSQPGTTIVTAINGAGTVTGFYTGSSYYSHDFVRSWNGHFITFEPVSGGNHTASVAINANSQTTGWGDDGQGGTYGFLRDVAGADTIFGASGAQGSAASGINDSGVIAGYEFSDGGGDAPFERDESGNIIMITLPFSNTASVSTGINQSGKIIGYYTDSAGANHGWVGTP
jgi:hypothetical protein